MNKKLMALLVGCIMLFSVTGCGGGSSNAPAASEPAAASGSSEAESSENGLAGWKMAMIVDAPIQDGNWNSANYAAMQAVAEKYGIETQYSENVSQSDFAQTFREYCNMGFQIIFSPGSQYADAAAEVAAEFPDRYFLLNNSGVFGENYVGMLADWVEQGYMAGTLAALQTQTGVVGFIGGMDLPPTYAKRENFTKAVNLLRPDVKVVDAIVGSFTDTAKGKEIITTMVNDNNVDVVYGDAGSIDAGAREFLKDFDDRYQIGQPGNITSVMPDVIISCVVTDSQRMLELGMEDILAGSFGNKVIEGTLANGVLYLGDFGNKFSEENQKKALEIMESIKSGTFETDYADGL